MNIKKITLKIYLFPNGADKSFIISKNNNTDIEKIQNIKYLTDDPDPKPQNTPQNLQKPHRDIFYTYPKNSPSEK